MSNATMAFHPCVLRWQQHAPGQAIAEKVNVLDCLVQAFPINCSYDIWDVKERLLKLLEAEPAVPDAANLASTTDNAVAAA